MNYRWVFFPFLFYFSPISYCRGKSETNNKTIQARILLNDPTLLNSKIEALERELQSVKSKLLEQETDLQSVKTSLLEQETKTQDLQHILDIKDTHGKFSIIKCCLFSKRFVNTRLVDIFFLKVKFNAEMKENVLFPF